MKIASRKQKGRSLQKMIVQTILRFFPSLTTNEVSSRSMGAPGTDILLSESALKLFPYSCESKNQETLNVWAAIGQAESNRKRGTEPLVIIKRNHIQAYAVIPFEHFMELVSRYTPRG